MPSRTTTFGRPPQLVLRFMVYAGLALALVGAATVLLSRHLATSRAQQQVWADTRFIADALGRDELAAAALERPATGDVRAELDDLFGREALGPGVVRATLFDRDGNVTYSTDHAQIGTTAPNPDDIGDALTGKAVYGVADLAGTKVIESYISVHWLADPTWPAGVLAVYRDYAPVAAEISDDTRLLAAGILASLLLLYLSLFPILHRVTRSLAASEARFRALTEQASDAIVVCDGGGRILEANPQALILFGGDPAGRSFADFVDAEDIARVPLRLAELHQGKTLLHERTLVARDGSRRLAEVHAKLLDDGRILASIRDITGRKEAEVALRKAEKAEATTRIASGVAHDFSDLLARIAGNSDLILARLPEADPLRRQAELIQDATARGAELTGQLLAFGRRRAAEPRVLDLADLLEDLGPSLQQLAGADVQLALDVADGHGRIEADPAQLRQLVLNLVVNARDGMPGGGRLTLTAKDVDFGKRDGRVGPGRYVMLAIGNSGSAGAGSDERLGLGLAAVFSLVQQSGGTIGVESDPGRGTTVRVYLPHAAGQAAAASAPDREDLDVSGSETVLVVEDELVVRALVREILEDQGYRVLEAGNGREGLDLARRHGEEIDLVLTDVVMPEMSGRELAAELERARPGCRVVLMSAYAGEAANGDQLVFLQKPFTHDTLARTIRETLDLAA